MAQLRPLRCRSEDDVAEIPDYKNLAMSQRQSMLRALLEERFKLKVHHETRPFDVYALVVDKKGLKLQETVSANLFHGEIKGITCHVLTSRKGHLGAQGCSMTNLAEMLRYPVGRLVVDRTGLTALYDITLDWTPEDASGAEQSAPDIFTALPEQLGAC